MDLASYELPIEGCICWEIEKCKCTVPYPSGLLKYRLNCDHKCRFKLFTLFYY